VLSIWHHHICSYHRRNSQHESARALALHHSTNLCLLCCSTPHVQPIQSSFIPHSTCSTAHKLCAATQNTRKSLHDKNQADSMTYQIGLPACTITISFMHSTASATAMQVSISSYKPDLYLSWEPDWTRIGPPWPLPGQFYLPLLQPTQNLPKYLSYYHSGRTSPRCPKKFTHVARPTTPTMAAKNLLCPPSLALTIV